MARIPTDIKISDTELLLCINRLRRAEDRQPIVQLPLPYSFLSHEQRYNIYTRYDSEYRIHLRDKHKFLDYKYQIILNKTEHKLHVHNKARVARQQPQLHFLPFQNIAQQDLKYYFPASRLIRPQQIFITDTDCKYITSVIQVTSGGSTQIRASHTFHLSISFNDKQSVFDPPRCSSPEFFTPPASIENSSIVKSSELPPLLIQQNIPPRVYPDLKDIFNMSSPSKRSSPSPLKRSHGGTDPNVITPNKIHFFQEGPPKLQSLAKAAIQTNNDNKNSTIEFSPSRLANAMQAYDTYRNPNINQISTDTVNTVKSEHLIPRNLFGTPSPGDSPPKYINNTAYPPSNNGAIPKGTPPMAAINNIGFANTGAIPKGTHPDYNNPINQGDAKDNMILEANKAAQLLIQQNTELRNNMIMLRLQYDSLMLKHKQSPIETPKKTTPFPTPSPPASPKPLVFSPPKLNLLNSDPKLSIFNSPKNKSDTEVKALQSQIAELVKQFGNIQIKIDQTEQKVESAKLTDVEKKALTRLAKKAAPEASTLIYALAKPTNIIPSMEPRNPQFLAILKGHAAIATLGTFDPERNPQIDFRDIWDRILNYTKNYKIYEHEYVDLLMTVMKGSAATILNGMIREYKGNLTQIIEAIQDIYIPQHTIYDDVEELNRFKRLPNENIKSMMRRASMIIERLKPTCAEAAWPDRKYHLLLSLLKQLIDKKTFKHLHSKELEAAQMGTQMEIQEVITTVALYEASHESIPKQETSLVYNINSLQLTNQPDNTQSEIDKLKLQINSLLPKKPRLDKNGRRSTPYPNSSSNVLKRPHPGSARRNASDSQNTSFSSQRDSRSTFNNSQRRPDGKRDFKDYSSSNSNRSFPTVNKWLNANSNSISNSNSSQRPILSTQKWRQNRSQSRDPRSQSRDSGPKTNPFTYRQSRSQSRDRYGHNSYDRYRSKSRGRSASRNRYGSRGQSFNKSFGRGTNTVTMTFYQCKLCPKTHLKGTPCNSNNIAN